MIYFPWVPLGSNNITPWWIKWRIMISKQRDQNSVSDEKYPYRLWVCRATQSSDKRNNITPLISTNSKYKTPNIIMPLKAGVHIALELRILMEAHIHTPIWSPMKRLHCVMLNTITMLKNRTIFHARALWNLARSCKQLRLRCLPLTDPWNLPGSALLSGFQTSCGALKSTG